MWECIRFRTAPFFKAMEMSASRVLADVVLLWLEHCRGSEGWGKGCPRATRPGGTSNVPPLLSLRSWLQVLIVSHSTQIERKTAFSPGERVSKHTQRKHTVSFQPLRRNWWILDRTVCILSGFTVQHCWKRGFIALSWFSLCHVLPSLDSTPGILLLCITWMYWPNIQYCR